MTDTAALPPRCPTCSALTPPDAEGRLPQFCSLCHAPLLAEEHVATEPVVTAVTAPITAPNTSPMVEPVTEQPESVAPVASGALDERAVEQMLIELQAADVDPWVARGRRMSTRGARIGLGIGIAVVVAIAVLVIAAVVGAVAS